MCRSGALSLRCGASAINATPAKTGPETSNLTQNYGFAGSSFLADQDDIWEPGKVAAIARAFGEPDVTLWFSDATLIDSRNQSLGTTAWEAVRFDQAARELVRQGNGLARLLHGETVTGATMAIRADVLSTAL